MDLQISTCILHIVNDIISIYNDKHSKNDLKTVSDCELVNKIISIYYHIVSLQKKVENPQEMW